MKNRVIDRYGRRRPIGERRVFLRELLPGPRAVLTHELSPLGLLATKTELVELVAVAVDEGAAGEGEP